MNVIIFLSCNSVILSTNKGGQINSVLFSHGPNKAFLVPDSHRVTERNGNVLALRITLVSVIFRQYGSCFGLFDIAY